MKQKLSFASRSIALACAFLSLALSTGALAQQGLPAGLADVKVSSSMRYELDLTPGDTRTIRVRLENTGAESATVSITQADMKFSDDGEVSFESANSTPKSNANWISVTSQAEVPAGGSIEVPFTLEVPNDPELHGSYWSLLVVKPLSPKVVDAETGNPEVHTSVAVSFQYAVTVLTHIGATDEQTVRFAQPGFAPNDEGTYQLQVTLHNPGEFVVAASTWLELYDTQGGLVKRVEGDDKRLYPDTSSTQVFTLGELDSGTYQAIVVADAGSDDVFGVRYNLDTTAQ